MKEFDEKESTGQTSDEKSQPPQKAIRYYFRILIYLMLFIFPVVLFVVIYRSSIMFPKVERIRLVGGSPKLTFHYIMSGIDTTLMKEFPTIYIKTNGAEENLQLLCNDKADIGLTHANLRAPCDGITAIANVFYTTLHIVSTRKSDVKKITDITCRTRVSIGPEGSGTAILAKQLLKFHELRYIPVDVDSFEQEQELLERGEIDVAFVFGGIPIRFIKELKDKRKYQLVDLVNPRAFVRNQPYLVEDSIEEGLYGGNPIFPSSHIKTVSVPTVLVVSPKFGHRKGADKIIEKITRLLFENRHELLRQHAAMMYLNEDFARSDVVYPLHPGAKRYYWRSKSGFLMTPESLGLAAYILALIVYGTGLLRSISRFIRRKLSTTYIREVQHQMREVTQQTSDERLVKIEEDLYKLEVKSLEKIRDKENPAYQAIKDAIERVKWFIGKKGG